MTAALQSVTTEGVKVTTQRTSKGPKVLMLLGMLAMIGSVFGFMAQWEWSLVLFAVGFVFWLTGRVAKWWGND